MRDVQAQLVSGPGLRVDVVIGEHRLRLDEPPSTPGGTDTGPAPTEVLLSALAACESITLKMYATRKGWPLTGVRVRLNAETVAGTFVIRRRLALEGVLDDAQRTRLREIADRCPVHRILSGEVRVEDEPADA